ncbi:hypothetical protein K0M31_004089 [Melipona bicolor]|uniref:Uncharacterized protein n=1 Tax=Melipona bicolor TaxID=60889 RepID=A0AA40FY46_9HYME|nr:hypothetical protein K0M31_004089 [Melipona bicolor]
MRLEILVLAFWWILQLMQILKRMPAVYPQPNFGELNVGPRKGLREGGRTTWSELLDPIQAKA